MLNENDLKQIKNLILSYHKGKKYFPFVEDLLEKYKMFFPENLDDEVKKQINDLVNETILEYVEAKKTKGGQIMLRLLQNNEELWKDFRNLNSREFCGKKEFQEVWKKIEKLVFEWEDRLTEKLVWGRSMWIQKASEAWYDMVYAIFPEWNKLK